MCVTQKDDLFPEARNPESLRVVNSRCLVRSQNGYRVVLVSGMPLAHYAVGDRMSEALAMVNLVDQGWADQDEVARSHAAQQMKQARGLAHQLAWRLPLGPGHGSSRQRSANNSAVDVPRLSSSRSSITRDGGATSVPSASRRAST